MMPEHYSEVNVKKVDFNLSKDEIIAHFKGVKTYRTTRYLVLHRGDSWSVAKIRKKKEPVLFPRIIGIDVLSLPKNTVFCEKEDIDVHNKTMMARVASSHGSKAVVVKGRFGHISFIMSEPVLDIRIQDVVPPTSRLITLAEEVVRISPLKRAVNFVPELIALEKTISEISTRPIMLPCRASELAGANERLFLDENPKLSSKELDEITLVGCTLSKRIFKSLYRREPKFINICPRDIASKNGLTLTRCCLVERPEVRGNTGVVPWGANVEDVHTALRRLVNMAGSQIR